MPLPSGHIVTADEFAATYNEDVFNGIGVCTLSTTSATYVDITSASKSWTKILGSAASDVLVEVSASCQSSVANTQIKIGVNLNAADTDVLTLAITSANVHSALATGRVRISSIPAGTYTVKLRALRLAGTGTLSMDAGDTVSFRIEEKVL